uniref:Uncharacterized protein n=1 Tax=Anguilla anguilla TaxID=7936 RepID=A0A0E9SDC4_ANGAN
MGFIPISNHYYQQFSEIGKSARLTRCLSFVGKVLLYQQHVWAY